MDRDRVSSFVDDIWDQQIVPQLTEYIRIPNKSPHYDPKWRENGHMEKAVQLIAGWCRDQQIEGLKVEIVRLGDRTPVIMMDIPGNVPEKSDDCVLLYGHFDKQPEMSGWDDDLGPWKPVLRDDKLYGRGGADDGYAAYASLTAIRAVQQFGGKHVRCVVLIEGCEESGSFDLPFYIDHLKERIGQPSLVVCLDSSCGNYDQLWSTTSLRGLVAGDLTISILGEGVHSGDASGIVPSSFRILRMLLSRIEDEQTGAINKAFHVEIPAGRIEQAKVAAKVLEGSLMDRYPFVDGAKPMDTDPAELILNRSWRPFLSVTGIGGMPSLDSAGNVLRPFTAARLSMRVPPTLNVTEATGRLKAILEKDPPYGAQVEFKAEQEGPGWNAPAVAPWLAEALERASQKYWNRESCYLGEGGSIPFMGMLGEKFPKAQFVITGLLGPGSNAHGPNEFLHVPTGKRLTAAVADILCDHAARSA